MDTLFSDYENLLIGKAEHVLEYNFYGSDSGGVNQKLAIACVKYALEDIMGYKVETSIRKFDRYLIRLLKLNHLMCYISWPVEIAEGDPKYILSLIYPDKVHINLHTLVQNVYKNILENDGQFPREYFTGTDGFYRLCICLKYLIDHYKPCPDIDTLYRYFLSNNGKSFLYQFRLKVPADQLSINILDCIHELTKNNVYSDLYYQYYMLISSINEIEDSVMIKHYISKIALASA